MGELIFNLSPPVIATVMFLVVQRLMRNVTLSSQAKTPVSLPPTKKELEEERAKYQLLMDSWQPGEGTPLYESLEWCLYDVDRRLYGDAIPKRELLKSTTSDTTPPPPRGPSGQSPGVFDTSSLLQELFDSGVLDEDEASRLLDSMSVGSRNRDQSRRLKFEEHVRREREGVRSLDDYHRGLKDALRQLDPEGTSK